MEAVVAVLGRVRTSAAPSPSLPPPILPTELYLPELRSCFRVILYETSSIAIVSFIGCTVVMYAAAELVPWLTVLDPACRWSVCTIAGEHRHCSCLFLSL